MNGKRVKVVRARTSRAEIDLRGLPKGTIRVRITIRYREGKALTGVRTYHTCTAKPAQGQAPQGLAAAAERTIVQVQFEPRHVAPQLLEPVVVARVGREDVHDESR